MEQTTPVTPMEKNSIPLKNEVWRLALQTFINLMISTVISAIIVFSLSALMVGSLWGKVLVEAICLAITLPMVYGFMWGQGDRDANFIQFGRMEPDKYKGLKAGALGIIPTLVTAIPLAMSMGGVFGKFDFMPFYRILNAPLWGFINMIKPNGGALPHAASPAIAATETLPAIDAIAATTGLGWGAFCVIALLPLIYLVFCAVGYYLGTKRISISSKVIYKNEKKRPQKRRPF